MVLSLAMSGLAEEGVSVAKTNVEWQAHLYPEIGLKIRLPHWKAEIRDDRGLWSLVAFPHEMSPMESNRLRLMINVNKCTEDQYLRLTHYQATNSAVWSDQKHSQQSPEGNFGWIYIQRDIRCPGGFCYICAGNIKRIQNMKPEDLENCGGSDERLAAEVQRVLDSIEIVSSNSTNVP